MTIKHRLSIDIYGCYIHVTVCSDIKKSINYYCKKYNKYDAGIDFAVAGFFFAPGDVVSDYYLFFDFKYLTMNAINHEISHVSEQILQDRGVLARGEQRAYLEGYISDKIYGFLKKRKIKIFIEKQ